jgi:hypothetical protein
VDGREKVERWQPGFSLTHVCIVSKAKEMTVTEQSNKPDGPHSSEHASDQHDLGFDPDSPDVADPQVDPVGPAIAPLDKKHKAGKQPAYDPLGDLKP